MLIIALLMVALAWHLINPDGALTQTAQHTPAPAPSTGLGVSADELMQTQLPDATPSQMADYTGFTLSFNPSHAIPNYVAWELTPAEVKTAAASRKSKSFIPDPEVEGCPASKDYAQSGYSRGHMCPAADMKWSEEAMHDCFYLTNMCPQASQLNEKAWADLEKACRNWAVRDSNLIIICGPVLTDRLTEKIGKATQVTVPRRFFKVVLAPYAQPPRAIAFIMPNGTVKGGYTDTAVPVDKVEQITGIDFFAALPDSIENELEAQCNISLWTQPRKRR